MDMDGSGFSGPEVSTADELATYTGVRGETRIAGLDRRRAVRLNYRQLEINYGPNVDFQLRSRQVLLCARTSHFLYTSSAARRVLYVPGTRPILEELAGRLVADESDEEARALVLMRFCRDLYRRRRGDMDGYIYGGSEEQLIEKGEELCECLGRLYVALCEVIGIAGRIVMHDIGGHIAAEIFIAGGWAYVDPRCGVYARAPDGHLASTWELWQHPEWLRRQPDHVKGDVSTRWTWEERILACEQKFFHPCEVNGFQNYSLMDADRYGYAQLTRAEVVRRGLLVINKEYRALARRIFGLRG